MQPDRAVSLSVLLQKKGEKKKNRTILKLSTFLECFHFILILFFLHISEVDNVLY